LNAVFAKHTLASHKRRINPVIRLAFAYRHQGNWPIKPRLHFIGRFGGGDLVMDRSKIIGYDRICL
jgi:hypothetical protein